MALHPLKLVITFHVKAHEGQTTTDGVLTVFQFVSVWDRYIRCVAWFKNPFVNAIKESDLNLTR